MCSKLSTSKSAAIFLLLILSGTIGIASAQDRSTERPSATSIPEPGLVESAFFADFDSEPPGLAASGFSLVLGGVPFDFIFTVDGDGYGDRGFSHVTAFGEGNSASINLWSGAFNVGTTERVTIARSDGGDFVFTSLFVNNRGGRTVTVAAVDNGVPVGTAQTVATGAAATLNFSGLVVDEVNLNSINFEDTTIDAFAGDGTAEKDYGDLPGSFAMTTDVNNGARHPIGSPYLGNCVDADEDGQASPAADGDDSDGSGNIFGRCDVPYADEDGVTPGPAWQDGAGGASIDVLVTGAGGCFSGWIDWDGDNALSDAGDHVLNMEAVHSGANVLTFDVPAGTFSSSSQPSFFARFRLIGDFGEAGDCSDDTMLLVHGPASAGEVEDYQWSFSPTSVDLQGFSASGDSGVGATPFYVLWVVVALAILSLLKPVAPAGILRKLFSESTANSVIKKGFDER